MDTLDDAILGLLVQLKGETMSLVPGNILLQMRIEAIG